MPAACFGLKRTATAALTAAGLVAGFLPAWRASRVDPMVALRYEREVPTPPRPPAGC